MWFSLSKVQSKNAGLLLNRVFEHISMASSSLKRNCEQMPFYDCYKRISTDKFVQVCIEQRHGRENNFFKKIKNHFTFSVNIPKARCVNFCNEITFRKSWKLNNFLPCLLCFSLVYLGRQIRIQEFLEKIWRFSMNNFCNFIRFLFFRDFSNITQLEFIHDGWNFHC